MVQGAGRQETPETVAALIKKLEDPESGIQTEAAKVLVGFADRHLPEYLPPPLASCQEQVALAAIEALGTLAFPEGELALLEVLRAERPAVRCKAAEMLGNLHI